MIALLGGVRRLLLRAHLRLLQICHGAVDPAPRALVGTAVERVRSVEGHGARPVPASRRRRDAGGAARPRPLASRFVRDRTRRWDHAVACAPVAALALGLLASASVGTLPRRRWHSPCSASRRCCSPAPSSPSPHGGVGAAISLAIPSRWGSGDRSDSRRPPLSTKALPLGPPMLASYGDAGTSAITTYWAIMAAFAVVLLWRRGWCWRGACVAHSLTCHVAQHRGGTHSLAGCNPSAGSPTRRNRCRCLCSWW